MSDFRGKYFIWGKGLGLPGVSEWAGFGKVTVFGGLTLPDWAGGSASGVAEIRVDNWTNWTLALADNY